MPLILRRSLDRPLTHDELDGNLIYLDVTEWKCQSYEKGMWVYIKGATNIAALYLCENTHNKNVYPSCQFAEVVNSVRIWRPFEGGGGGVFINPDPSTATNLEGIPAGSTFPLPGKTMQEMWDMLLYPYKFPSFTLFTFLTHYGTLEVGNSFSGDTASWSVNNLANVQPNSVEISGYNLTTVTGLPAIGSEALTFTAPVTRTSRGTRTWTITAQNTHLEAFSTTFSLTWEWMFYWGTSPNTMLTETQIKALSNSDTLSAFFGNYTFATGDYKYLCIPDVYCSVSQYPAYFYDLSVGLQVAMNDGYAHYDNNNSTYDLVNVTNQYGLTTAYRVYRTKWQVGALTIVVT